MAILKNLSIYLTPVLLEDDYNYIADKHGEFLEALKAALANGATPDDIYRFYMDRSPTRQATWVRAKHAAMYIQQTQDKGVQV